MIRGKTCSKCKVELPTSEFFKDKKRKDGFYPQCKSCRKQYTQDPVNREKLKAYHKEWNAEHKLDRLQKDRLRKYGLSSNTIYSMLEAQGWVCANTLCEKEITEKTLHVDHDHSCCPHKKACEKCVRGLLCSNCNVGLGFFSDDKKLLLGMIYYLESRKI